MPCPTFSASFLIPPRRIYVMSSQPNAWIWRNFIIAFTPVVFSLLFLIGNSQEMRCGYVMVVMAVYWVTEVLPLFVTALVPVFAFPLLGVLSSGEVCKVYLSDSNMMFLGGLIMAVAVEHSNLHERVSLFAILHIGQSPRRLALGFMLITSFLSMWISNTSTAAIIVPIVDAVVGELIKLRQLEVTAENKTKEKEEERGRGKTSEGAKNGDREEDIQKEEVEEEEEEEEGGVGEVESDRYLHQGPDNTYYDLHVFKGGTEEFRELARGFHIPAEAMTEGEGEEGKEDARKANHKEENETNNHMEMREIHRKEETGGVHQWRTSHVEEGMRNHEEMKERANHMEMKGTVNHVEMRRLEEIRGECLALKHMLFLAVAFAANIGGTGSPLGCGPNIVLMGLMDSMFHNTLSLNFATWMLYNVPGMLLCVAAGWLWLQVLYMYCGKNCVKSFTPERESALRRFLEGHYKNLGSVSRREAVVVVAFVCLVLLWVFRDPGFFPGWATLFPMVGKKVTVKASTPVMLIIFLMFCIPTTPKPGCRKKEACLTWEVVHKRVPWGIVILLGGGVALAEGSKRSGLSMYFGTQLAGLRGMPKEALQLVVCLLAGGMTELASNTATASVLLPIVANLAVAIRIHPLYLLLPATACCVFAFMLPVATPGNAIVLSASGMGTMDMMRAGFVMNVICIIITFFLINTFGYAIFDLSTLPPIIDTLANTAAASTTTTTVITHAASTANITSFV